VILAGVVRPQTQDRGLRPWLSSQMPKMASRYNIPGVALGTGCTLEVCMGLGQQNYASKRAGPKI